MSQEVNRPKDLGHANAEEIWARGLQAWAIPSEILAVAPASPWRLVVEQFSAQADAADSPSHRRAREAMPSGGCVLDIGQGGGRASFALVPPAATVIGVEERPQMIAAAAAEASRRGVAHTEILGRWPDIAQAVPTADVVVSHHVIFNVPDLRDFALAAHAHAHRRVVFELSYTHPLSWMAPLWQHFWGVRRPDGPTADLAVAVIRQAGVNAQIETWDDDRPGSTALSWEQRVELTRTRLCLAASRDEEVAEQLTKLPARRRRTATIWWDRHDG